MLFYSVNFAGGVFCVAGVLQVRGHVRGRDEEQEPDLLESPDGGNFVFTL
jgi:hypothetical protein